MSNDGILRSRSPMCPLAALQPIPHTIASAAVRVETLDRDHDARRLAAEWSDLIGRALGSDPFMTPEWYLSWWNAFGEGRMKLLAVRKGETLIGVAPLRVVKRRLWGSSHNVLELWSNEFSNRAHVVLDERCAAEAADAMVGALAAHRGEWDVARLGPLLEGARATKVLTQALAARGAAWGIRGKYSSPYLRLPKSWAEVESSLSGSFRTTVRRVARKASKAGNVTVSHSGNAPGDADAAFAISEHTWQHQLGTGIGSNPSIERFYREVAAGAAQGGWLSMAYLLVDGRPIAFEYNLRFKNEMYNVKVGYRDEDARLSPGLVLRRAVLESCVTEGVSAFDFLGEPEEYKLHWTRHVRPHVSLWIHNRGIKSRVAHFAYFGVRPLVARRIPWLLGLKRRFLNQPKSTE